MFPVDQHAAQIVHYALGLRALRTRDRCDAQQGVGPACTSHRIASNGWVDRLKLDGWMRALMGSWMILLLHTVSCALKVEVPQVQLLGLIELVLLALDSGQHPQRLVQARIILGVDLLG